MKTEEIKQIKITKDEAIVNKYLLEGYKIVKILSTRSSTGFGEEIQPTFILGTTKLEKKK